MWFPMEAARDVANVEVGRAENGGQSRCPDDHHPSFACHSLPLLALPPMPCHKALHLNLPSPSHKTIPTTPTLEPTLAHVVAKPNLPELLHHQSS
jgi:hypothetical protein